MVYYVTQGANYCTSKNKSRRENNNKNDKIPWVPQQLVDILIGCGRCHWTATTLSPSMKDLRSIVQFNFTCLVACKA